MLPLMAARWATAVRSMTSWTLPAASMAEAGASAGHDVAVIAED